MMNERDFIKQFINKKVDLKFHGNKFQFNLSQSLFSSYDIDNGTRLLLKTIAKNIDLSAVESLLDVGCGIGVIGICLKNHQPGIDVTFQDRDALALSFTSMNAALNRIGPVKIQGSLALHQLQNKKFDLIVSNLPGKAGPSVITDIVRRIPQFLTQNGQAAVVIVKPLENIVEETLLKNNSQLIFKEDRKGYSVFLFKGGEGSEIGDSITPYLRDVHTFKSAKISYILTTAHNIPEFDNLGYHTSLAMNLINKEQIKGRVMFWNPGQGHFPVYLAKNLKETISDYVLASRDLLAIKISQMNLVEQGVPEEIITPLHRVHALGMSEKFDFIVSFPDIDPGVPWDRVLLNHYHDLLTPGGKLLITAKSSFIHRLLSADKELRVEISKKRHGYRSIILVK